MHGLTRDDVRNLAFQLAKRNGIDSPFSEDGEMPGLTGTIISLNDIPNFHRDNPRQSLLHGQGLSTGIMCKSFSLF